MTTDRIDQGGSDFRLLLEELARSPPRPLDDGAPELGHYRIVGRIGQGGMGSVWQAEDRRLGRTIAIKRIAAGAVGDETARRRLLLEARVAASLNHPNVVTIHSVEELGGVDFIVMELIDGESLAARIASGPQPLADVVAIGAQIADALACAHDAGLVHRDVKPQNVMVTRRGLVKVLDFGVAKRRAVAHDSTALPLTADGAIVGTVPYMAPEQLRGEELDGRADIFALGCLLFELATGRRAFAAVDVATCIHDITMVDPPAPSELVPGLPLAFDEVVRRALAKERASRFAGAAEVAEALRVVLAPTEWLSTQSGASAVRRAEGEPLLVGREAELSRVEALLRQVAAGRGALLLATGEAGIGKSALVDAAVRRARAAGFAVGRGACIGQLDGGEAWHPLLQALGDLVSPGGEAVRAAILALAPTWAAQIPSLSRWGGEKVVANKGRMLLELGEAVAGLSARRPVALVLEDLHWADPSTMEALRHLAAGLDGKRALVLATARADELDREGHPLRAAFSHLRGRHAVHELALGDLAVEGVARWIDARFGPNDFDRRLAGAVHQRTEGHPLSVAAMLDVLAAPGEGGARPRIWRDDRGWHASVEERDLTVPANIAGVLHARLDGLRDDERALLSAAAVQGTEFIASVLADATSTDELEVEDRLAALARSERLVRRIADEELPDGSVSGRWRLAHALYHDVLYAAVPAARRVVLHRRTAESLLARHGADRARAAAALGMHFERARDWPRAHEHLLQAGDNAIAVFASIEAESHFLRALSCAERLGPAERTRAVATAHQRLAGALVARGAFLDSARALEEAMKCAQELGDEALQGDIHVGLLDTFTVAHRLEDARRAGAAAIAVASAHGLEELIGRARTGLATTEIIVGNLEGAEATLAAIPGPPSPLGLHLRGLVDYLRADYVRAEENIGEAIARESELPDLYWRTEVRMFHGLAVASRGRLAEGLRILGAAHEMARRSESLVNIGRIGNSIGWLRRELGMEAQAIELDEHAVAVGRTSGESEAEAQALVNLVESFIEHGPEARVATALARIDELAAGDDWMRWRYLIRADAARARLAVARLDPGAEAAVERLRERARLHGAAKYLVIGCMLAARLAEGRGDLGSAWRSIEEGRALLARNPAPLVAWKLEARAAVIARGRRDPGGERAARERAREIIARLAEGLGDAERAAFAAHTDSILGA